MRVCACVCVRVCVHVLNSYMPDVYFAFVFTASKRVRIALDDGIPMNDLNQTPVDNVVTEDEVNEAVHRDYNASAIEVNPLSLSRSIYVERPKRTKSRDSGLLSLVHTNKLVV